LELSKIDVGKIETGYQRDKLWTGGQKVTRSVTVGKASVGRSGGEKNVDEAGPGT